MKVYIESCKKGLQTRSNTAFVTRTLALISSGTTMSYPYALLTKLLHTLDVLRADKGLA